MKPDITWMKVSFEAFNNRYFKSQLPLPVFKLTNARTYLGNMRWKEDRLRHRRYQFVLSMSTRFDLEEKLLLSVMLHEMIHYYISYNWIKDTSPHGKVFRGIMEKLNACGWDIQVSHRTVGGVTRQERPGRRLIGVIFMENGTFFSVINPGYVGRILYGLRSVRGFKDIRWFISSDDYFKRFPLTRSLRGVKISSQRLEELKKMMTPVVLKEGMVI
ncbi:MAG: SprT-like domain-containing protein [Prevotella sp.]|jgi:ribosomal protein L17